MFRNYFRLSAVFICLLPIISGGCTGKSQKSAYYVFSTSQAPPSAALKVHTKSLGVGPISIPKFLKRPQIVTRQGKNMLSINDFHRWGDSLEDQISSVLVNNLCALHPTSKVIAHPWERLFTPEYQIYLDFRRFEGKPGESVQIEVVWQIVDTKTAAPVLIQRSSLKEPAGRNGYKDYVIALNTGLEKLSQEIAAKTAKVLP